MARSSQTYTIKKFNVETVLNDPDFCYLKEEQDFTGKKVFRLYDTSGTEVMDDFRASTLKDAKEKALREGLIPMTLH